MKAKEEKISKQKKAKLAETECNDKACHIHGTLKTRGRTFKGVVIRKFHKRVTIQFERMVYVKKYERYTKKQTKIHARLPDCMEKQINLGDLISVKECRPLSKIIHFVVIEKLKDSSEVASDRQIKQKKKRK